MAVLISNRERYDRAREIVRMTQTLARSAKDIDRFASRMISEGQSPSTVNTNIGALLTDWDAMRDQVGTELANISETYQQVIKVGMPANFAAFQFVPCANSKGVIQPVGATTAWGALFDADDIVSIANAEDADNNRTWKVLLSPSGGVLTDYINNGGFASGTSWTAGAGWTISGGKATHTPGSTNALQQLNADLASAPAGSSVFIVTFTVSTCTAGSVTASFGGSYSHVVSANGTYTVVLDIGGGADLSFTPTSAFDGSIDDVTAYAVRGLVVEGIPSTQALTSNSNDTSAVLTLQEDN